MQININLGKLSETNTLKTVENLTHINITEKELIKYFNFLKENSLIKANKYEDIVWRIYDENRDRDIIFKFDIEMYKELNKALKGFILLKRMTGVSILSCHRYLIHLKKVIIATNKFEDLGTLESLFISQTPLTAYEMAGNIRRFMSFYEPSTCSEVIKICNQIKKTVRKNRSLPYFPDVIAFDDAIRNFFDKAPSEDYIRFYPILIWWKLTNVLPMRVIEFLKLKKNCVEKKEDRSFWITLPREKKKADSPFKIDVTDTIQINQEVYELILQYIQIIDKENIETDYLLPYDLYVKFLPYPIRSSSQRLGTKNRLTDKYLQRILDDFYALIVNNDTLTRINLGDTRHFAIMNMFLQGFNMLSIARMAGHEDLEMQFSYYSHVDHFVESQVYLLAQKKLEQNIEDTIGSKMTNSFRYLYDKGLMYEENDLTKYRKVNYGFCTNANFPDNCAGECRICDPYYIFKPAINDISEGLKWLTDYSKSIQRNTKELTDMMFSLSKNMYYNYRSLTHQESGQFKLNTASSNLTKFMEQRATVEAWIRSYREDDK